MALASLARKFSSLPMPMMSGEPRRAPTMVPGWSRANHGEAVSADDFAQRVANGLGQKIGAVFATSFFVKVADQMREDFRVGVGSEFVSGLDQPLFEDVVIFNDAVVDDGNFAGGVECAGGNSRPKARRAWPSACGRCRGFPAPVRRSRRVRDPRQFSPFFCEPAGLLSPQDRHAGAVVTAIFQPPQRLRAGWARPLFSRRIR